MAQPSKRTPENRKRIIDMLAGGIPKSAACEEVRISRETLNKWENEEEEFRDDIAAAKSAAIARNVLRLQKATEPRAVKKTRTEVAPKKDADGNVGGRLVKVAQTVEEYEEDGDWRAALAWLERMDRGNFGKSVDVTSGGEKLPAATVLVGLDRLEEAEIDRRLAEAEGRKAPADLPEAP